MISTLQPLWGFCKSRITGSAHSGKAEFRQRQGIPQTPAQATGTGNIYGASTKGTLKNELLQSAQLFREEFEGLLLLIPTEYS